MARKNNARYNYVARYKNNGTGEFETLYIEDCQNADDARAKAHDSMVEKVEKQINAMHMFGYVADVYIISESDAEKLVNANWRCVSCKRAANVSTQGHTGRKRVRRGKSGDVRTTTIKAEKAAQKAAEKAA